LHRQVRIIVTAFFNFLHDNPYILLFLVVGLSVWVGRGTIKGYGLGAVAGAIVIGCVRKSRWLT